MKIEKNYDLFVELENKEVIIGSIKKFIYANDIYYLVKRKGFFEEVYNEKQLKNFFKNNNIKIKF